MSNVNDLKAEVFDLLVQIEQHQNAIQHLNQKKAELLEQINKEKTDTDTKETQDNSE